MADPLSSAVLRLDLVERRLLAPSAIDPAWVAERVRGARVDLGRANRLLDLLLRLAEITDERPAETSVRDLCQTAGLPLDETVASIPPLSLRRLALAEAIGSVATFLARESSGAPPMARAGLEGGRITLAIAGCRVADARPERLLDLPHGVEEAEALFVARAAAEADGGRLEMAGRNGQLVASFSWPVEESALPLPAE
jgi:hypothetical protein